jgi:hypothetical protein
MRMQPVYRCRCPDCRRRSANPAKEAHARLNMLLSTMDERQQRLLVGYESQKLGHGGDRRLAVVTGLNVHTIAKGRRELDQFQPAERIRLAGGGRARVEKKTQ